MPFEDWFQTLLPDYRDTTYYNLRRAYELAPVKDLIRWSRNPKKHHLRSVYIDENGDYEFMKSPQHPTIQLELDWYNSDKANKFRRSYQLDSTITPWKYVKIKGEQ